MAESVLSVFCDESGDFGSYELHSPYYLVSLVFHDPSSSIDKAASRLSQRLRESGHPEDVPVHTAPLIRREPPYSLLGMTSRRKLFGCLMGFMRSCPIRTKTFVISKRHFGGGSSLSVRLARQMGLFLRENLSFFQTFDRVIVYYDRGQREVANTLRVIFSTAIAQVEFRTVSPTDYRLFQVADLVCTLELASTKLEARELSASELSFFHGERGLKRNYLRALEKIRM